MSKKFLAGMLLLVVVSLGALAWLERADLWAWYTVRVLASATDANREDRAGRVAQLGETAVPGLLACLHEPHENVCQNARAGLEALVVAWDGPQSPRTTDLAARLAREFPQLSPAAQRQLLQLATIWNQPAPGSNSGNGLLLASARILTAAGLSTDPEVQTQALELCAVLVADPQGSTALSPAREMVRAYLQSSNATVRLRAIQVSLQAGMDLLENVANLLADPSAEVRRAALVAVGPAEKVVMDETLLPCLRDPDPDVRRLCEAALRGRGLGPEHLGLARLLIDPNPAQRMKVLELMQKYKDLDPGIWLRRLSHDAAPSVRAAAVRVMSKQTTIDLTDRLDQMAHEDPCPSVCYIAAFFLKDVKSRQAEQARP